jgi:hypothetical protein
MSEPLTSLSPLHYPCQDLRIFARIAAVHRSEVTEKMKNPFCDSDLAFTFSVT